MPLEHSVGIYEISQSKAAVLFWLILVTLVIDYEWRGIGCELMQVEQSSIKVVHTRYSVWASLQLYVRYAVEHCTAIDA